ncbi:TIGR02646 family protein [Flexibacter flexilis DSM 6793]|uniref:TIGR02646 family protein n=1 Tax=Flexibacter flexilis DSM 6793 TaxID=927664 RepID=A0A1I1I8J0_9BACT|nr:retron system putative HNH endonuclease [Flexibacter flexilis]SFC29550.1 TIGR02646 family protein [Flexibacter flexilis DSM 6793]
MKYIKKKEAPEFFITDVMGLSKWSEYDSKKKKRLKKYILENEQSHLCCYCEKLITEDKTMSHVEHVKPKSIDLHALTFDYSNLLVSCEGNHFNEIGDNSRYTCGQIKGQDFDEKKFLNPTLIHDISSYFKFDIETGLISSSGKNNVNAEFTYKILNLNGYNNRLAEARKIAKDSLIRNFSQIPLDNRKVMLKNYLSNDSNEFITFLRYVFRDYI